MATIFRLSKSHQNMRVQVTSVFYLNCTTKKNIPKQRLFFFVYRNQVIKSESK